MQEINSILNTAISGGNSHNVLVIFFTLTVSLILAVPLALLYMKMHRKEGYDQGLVQSFIILTVIIAAVMMIIGNNLARAFGLVGAVSIIRFRTKVKSPKDTAFIFMFIAIGMACGLNLYGLAVTTTVFMILLIIILWLKDFGNFEKEIK